MSPDIIKLLPFLVIVPLVVWRMQRMSRKRPLKLGLLWLRPAYLLAVCAAVLLLPQPGVAQHHFTPMDVLVLGPAIALGAIGGWYMGRTMKIDVHPDQGTLMVQSSPVGLLVILGLVAIRFAVRFGARAEAQAWHLDLALIFDALILFTAALFVARAAEMYLRAKRVMRAHTGEAFS